MVRYPLEVPDDVWTEYSKTIMSDSKKADPIVEMIEERIREHPNADEGVLDE